MLLGLCIFLITCIVFQLPNDKTVTGFIVIPNPFKPKYQRYWIQRCLLDFPVKPNRTNLDAHMERPSQIWHQCVNESWYAPFVSFETF